MKSFLAILCCTLLAISANALTVDSLRCDFRDAPLGIDSTPPCLSWMPEGHQRGERATAYQICVGSSESALSAGGNLWDSGKVMSGQNANIPYAGAPLSSFQRVYWRVRLWDANGVPTAWSAAACWTMGVLNETDWQGAKWIGAPDANQPFDPNGAAGPKPKYETVLLRRELAVRPGLTRALVYICGLAQYEMTLNGAKVGDALLTPGWTAYDKTCLYDSYDVTASLHPGPNAMGLFLGNGFYNTHGQRYTKVHGSYGPLKAIALIRMEYADGSIQNVVTDEHWKTSSGPIVFSSIYGGEDYDARLEQQGWDKPGFNDSGWDEPAVTGGPGGVLKGLSGAAPPIRVMQTLSPIAAKQIKPNVTVYDFGQNAAIMAVIKLRGSAGDTVKVTPSELVNAEGDINERMCNNDSYCTYTLNGKGEETDAWRFYYRGGRYLRVETKAAAGGDLLPNVTSIQERVIRADSPPAGRFSCSNELLNKVFGIIRWAQMSNMMSILTDCPHREKLGWLEEDHLNGPALRYNFDMSAVFTKMVNDMYDAQRANGLVPSLVPNYYHWDEGRFTTPIEWGSACIIVPWQQYEFEGDLRMLQQRYDGMKRYIDYIAKRAQNNIVSSGLGDWYDNHSEGFPTLTPIALTDTAFYYYDYDLLARIARILGKEEEADAFQHKADEVRDTFNQKFFDPSTNNYATGAQGSNCLPLAMNIADPAKRPAILDNLVRDLEAKGTTTGEVSFRYLLKALADGGRSDLIYTTYSTDTQGYGLQVKLGKTTLTEAWNGGNASQNHFMFGQINEWFYHDLAGIQPDPAGPGFEKIIIKPAIVGDLAWAGASYRSVRGDIASSWSRGPDGIAMEVSIPVGSTATVYVPTAAAATVRESGLPAISSAGVSYLGMENGAAKFRIGSGSYRFTSPR